MDSHDSRIGFLVFRTARSMKKALDSRLTEYHITSSQYTVLSALGNDDCLSLSEISKRVYLDKPAITALADHLEQEELVERRRSPEDRRIVRLCLTEKGRKLQLRFEEIARNIDDELIREITPEELVVFRTILNRIWLTASRDLNGET